MLRQWSPLALGGRHLPRVRRYFLEARPCKTLDWPIMEQHSRSFQVPTSNRHFRPSQNSFHNCFPGIRNVWRCSRSTKMSGLNLCRLAACNVRSRSPCFEFLYVPQLPNVVRGTRASSDLDPPVPSPTSRLVAHALPQPHKVFAGQLPLREHISKPAEGPSLPQSEHTRQEKTTTTRRNTPHEQPTSPSRTQNTPQSTNAPPPRTPSTWPISSPPSRNPQSTTRRS
jgi:hypothetical protein